MKTLKQITELVEENKLYLKKKYNIKSIGIFGSYTRGQSTEESDVDI